MVQRTMIYWLFFIKVIILPGCVTDDPAYQEQQKARIQESYEAAYNHVQSELEDIVVLCLEHLTTNVPVTKETMVNLGYSPARFFSNQFVKTNGKAFTTVKISSGNCNLILLDHAPLKTSSYNSLYPGINAINEIIKSFGYEVQEPNSHWPRQYFMSDKAIKFGGSADAYHTMYWIKQED